MDRLVNEHGLIKWGIYPEAVDRINYEDYHLETPLGIQIPPALRKILVNQFHFIGVVGPDLMAGIGVVDLKYLSNGFFYVFDRKTGRITETKSLAPPLSVTAIDPFPERPRSIFSGNGLTIEITKDSLKATGKGISLDLTLDLSSSSPLRICTRAGYRGWVYTQKTSPIKVEGRIITGPESRPISSPAYLALSDWTTGFMRRQTCWNWASTAFKLPDGRQMGMNLSCGVNETSFTENAFWLGNAMTKVDTVDFEFDRNNLSGPWKILSQDKKVDLVFSPDASRAENINALFVASRFTQLFGVFEGTLTTDSGEKIRIEACPGFAEDHFARW